ncbi:MAG: hypothetical protein ACFCBW_16520 [Candidatus Competibacterales bacterium]
MSPHPSSLAATVLLALLALVLSVASISPSVASNLTFDDWKLDVRNVERDVIDPLNRKFQDREEASWQDYGLQFLLLLRTIRDDIHPDSYHLMRNSVLTSLEDLEGFANDDYTWQDAAQYIRTKLSFVGDVLNLIGR